MIIFKNNHVTWTEADLPELLPMPSFVRILNNKLSWIGPIQSLQKTHGTPAYIEVIQPNLNGYYLSRLYWGTTPLTIITLIDQTSFDSFIEALSYTQIITFFPIFIHQQNFVISD